MAVGGHHLLEPVLPLGALQLAGEAAGQQIQHGLDADRSSGRGPEQGGQGTVGRGHQLGAELQLASYNFV